MVITEKKARFPLYVWWGLTAIVLLHFLGTVILIDGEILYKIILIPIVGYPYFILKFDQVMHFLGFFVITLIFYYILKPMLSTKQLKFNLVLLLIIAMIGLGVGGIKEILDFIMSVLLQKDNTIRYQNTGLDLISDLVGAMSASLVVWYTERKNNGN
tara:strand:+ start:1504 stop:1974 length:471 start_codon:yes stop_codon:yes gene_type:complete